MASSDGKEKQSDTPELAKEYKEAVLLEQAETPMACSSSAEVGAIPLRNTVFARSDTETREAIVEPIRIKKSLESLDRNRRLQSKGLG